MSIVFRWLEQLKREPGEAARYQWRVIPVLNPDGLLAKPPTRVNARGVDLNRNFPTENWSLRASHYWSVSTRRDPRRFPGKALVDLAVTLPLVLPPTVTGCIAYCGHSASLPRARSV